MKNKKIDIAKMASTFGITGLLAGIGLISTGETFICMSSSIAGILLTIIGFKTMNDINKR